MGIKKIKVEKKVLPKLLPSLNENLEHMKHKLSKADENFYQQYSTLNENIAGQKIGNEDLGLLMSPLTPFKNIQADNQESPSRRKSTLPRKESNIIYDYGEIGEADGDNKKYYYRQ